MTDEQLKEEVRDIIRASHNNRCPDYDEDCKKVKDHLRCFIGNEVTDGIAKGYCPFIHLEN